MKTVLCIEDDRFIGEMYVRSLKREGYEVDWVVNGGDGLAAVESKKYDFILIDIMLPNKRGDELVRILRGGEEDKVPNSKVLVLTNYQQDAQSRLQTEDKVDAYLIKADITPKKLLQVMAKLGGEKKN
ncbi:response regulator [Candidatus Saccharibacteria bacterium]|nr:response regulator [Candidatus Saccharibacteria bacterium]